LQPDFRDQSLMEAYVQGVAVWGPGLHGWAASQPVLSGLQPYVAGNAIPPPSTLLSASERRRTGLAARLALIVAQQASDMAGIPPGAIPSIFATSNGDGAVVHAILEALAADQPVSPTQFHNSVHNTAAGYWSIATGSRHATTCIACHDATAATALLKAIAEVRSERRPLLLCVYDVPLPAPLDTKRRTFGSFGAGFVLTPKAGRSALSRLDAHYEGVPPTPGSGAPCLPPLRELARDNPAGRMLRLLEILARGVPDEYSMALLDGRVEVRVTPCSTERTSSN
jgi:Beta-ketoacyl synthase, N-terminal domain